MDAKMQLQQIQRKLAGFGLYDGDIDGVWGQKTYLAMGRVIDGYSGQHTVAVDSPDAYNPHRSLDNPIPAKNLPDAHAKGIVVHWTAGTNVASPDSDGPHYHFIIDGDGSIVVGHHSVADNDSTTDGVYAAHTRGCNTGFIGVSLAGMAGAVESPFSAGKYPINQTQWKVLIRILAQLCRRYAITPTPKTVLSHAEVQGTLGIQQAGKWDIARLPWDSSMVGATAIGNKFRRETSLLLAE